jgi:hypothetical protein
MFPPTTAKKKKALVLKARELLMKSLCSCLAVFYSGAS